MFENSPVVAFEGFELSALCSCKRQGQDACSPKPDDRHLWDAGDSGDHGHHQDTGNHQGHHGHYDHHRYAGDAEDKGEGMIM